MVERHGPNCTRYAFALRVDGDKTPMNRRERH